MNSSDLFYLKDAKSGKYYSIHGLTDDIESATKFTDTQLKIRFKVPKTHNNVFKQKIENSGMILEPVDPPQEFEIKINSKFPYKETSILFCNAKFFYKNETISYNVVYSKFRDNIRYPDVLGKPIRVELDVIKVTGDVIK